MIHNSNIRLINKGAQKPLAPLVNWSRLNEEGKKERATEIAAEAALDGAKHGAIHAASKGISTGENVTPREHAKNVGTGGVISAAGNVVKDVYDTVRDRPNKSGTYMDGGNLSSVQKRNLGPNGERVNE